MNVVKLPIQHAVTLIVTLFYIKIYYHHCWLKCSFIKKYIKYNEYKLINKIIDLLVDKV